MKQRFMDDAISDEQQLSDHKKKNKIIEPLKPFDFSEVVLQDFDKNFYEEHEEIATMSP